MTSRFTHAVQRDHTTHLANPDRIVLLDVQLTGDRVRTLLMRPGIDLLRFHSFPVKSDQLLVKCSVII